MEDLDCETCVGSKYCLLLPVLTPKPNAKLVGHTMRWLVCPDNYKKKHNNNNNYLQNYVHLYNTALHCHCTCTTALWRPRSQETWTRIAGFKVNSANHDTRSVSGQFHEYKGDQRSKVTSRPHQAKHTFAHVNKCIVYVNTCTVYMQKLNIANVLFVSPV